MYKYIRYITLFIITVVSCTKEQSVPVKVDFELLVENDDYSVPVQIKIHNKTTGADAYQWTIDGTNANLSKTSRNPGTALYEKSGIYAIKLYASNQDGQEDSSEMSIEIFDAVAVDFEAGLAGNNFSPAEIQITNTTEGTTFYRWQFEGGQPEYSDMQHPENVVFTTPGEHTITLTAGTGFEEFTTSKTITVAPYLEADFDWEVAFEDDDYQVPVTMTMMNNSVSATSYKWTFENGSPVTSMEENPSIVFNAPGEHTITLEATNGKETKIISKTIEVYPNTNLRLFNDISLGINTAHNSNNKGAFFSTVTREVYTKDQVNETNGPLIDLVFFGLDEAFSYNKFVAPDKVAEGTTFQAVPGATHTKFINSQEQCGCSTSMTSTEFDTMTDDSLLQILTIEETNGGLQHFTGETIPRIILFETADGRKGAIKIKEYHPQGQDSYIIADIKVQKEKQ
ncbi:PKD domain-containing protein [Zhouia spongiae]|uniref:PKD domain-containing protein n=1 Tax=Zhouia spongiae TaxID=2202721 RepID=A0ABY3YN39_9FLAO|nr:PKD domain-containing protein [Zhouia spongiae]UNY99058.1 PKD domain-containing protein [Zhouia spongiae]